MISPSENASGTSSLFGIPVKLLGGAQPGTKVSRLQFHVIDRPKNEPMQDADVDAISPLTGTEIRQQKDLATLEEELALLRQQIAEQIETARSEARIEARREWERELEEKLDTERACVMRTCEEFRIERAHYFADVEAEVVKLALAIAARVLHREAALDPLLLLAVVRVALEKAADHSAITLRVPSAEAERWRQAVALEAKCEMQVIGDERLDMDECILETNVGRIELGISAQLQEIEKGFFDLLQQRPA